MKDGTGLIMKQKSFPEITIRMTFKPVMKRHRSYRDGQEKFTAKPKRA